MNKVAIGVFFGIAIAAAASRVVIPLWAERLLRLDGCLLLSSCACLIAATGVLYYGIPSVYFTAKLELDPAALIGEGLSEQRILHEVYTVQRINWTYITLSWTAIFLSKYGFLALFRSLVDRLPRMQKFWKATVIFTTLVFAFAICDVFVACPKQGIAAGQ